MKTAKEIEANEFKKQIHEQPNESVEKLREDLNAQFIKPPELSAEDITESLRNSYFKETGEQALTNDYALWCENKIVDHRQYIQHPQPPYGREVYEWVKASERLPEGTVYAKDKNGEPCEMSVHNDKVAINLISGHYLYEFSDSELYTYEWLSRTTLPAQVEGEWHSKFSGNVETDQHKIWEHILKLWSEHKDTTFDFIHEMKDKFTLIQNYAHDDKLENTLPAPEQGDAVGFTEWIKKVKKEQKHYPLFKGVDLDENQLLELFKMGKTPIDALNDLSTMA